MNSRLPIENLDGYFLRLRLAKWEEGVGGTGYYVACITGITSHAFLPLRLHTAYMYLSLSESVKCSPFKVLIAVSIFREIN